MFSVKQAAYLCGWLGAPSARGHGSENDRSADMMQWMLGQREGCLMLGYGDYGSDRAFASFGLGDTERTAFRSVGSGW